MQHIGNSVRDQYAQINVDAVTDYTIQYSISNFNASVFTRTTSGTLFGSLNYDLRSGNQTSSPSVDYGFWGDFVNEWLHIHVSRRFDPQGTSGTIRIRDASDLTNEATFDWNDIVYLDDDHTYFALSIRAEYADQSSGTPPTSGRLLLTITDDGGPVPGKQILLHLSLIHI